jgi:sulfur-oxidizing protein SoxZ
MKIKAKLKDGIVDVKAMAKHEMMTYDVAEKKTGDRNNANYITHISGTVNGETVLDMTTSQFLSKNPIFKFEFKGDTFKAGDELVMTWVDLKGNTVTSSTDIK